MSTLMDHVRQDLRSAWRNLRRYPIAATVAIASLAAGIGATTVSLTVRDVIFHNMPPLYRDPAQVSLVQVGRPDRPIMPAGSPVPGPLFAIWREHLGGAIAAMSDTRGVRDVRTADRTVAEPVRAVTANLFALLGVDPILGTIPAPATGRSDVAVLSNRAWQHLFDGRSDAIGRTLWMANRPMTVAAVMPQRFWVGDMESPVWTLMTPDAGGEEALEVFVRRAPRVSHAALEAALAPGLMQYAARQAIGERQLRVKASGVEGTPVGKQMSFILPYVLGTSVLLTLVIACANVAILMIAAWTGREQEIAIRAAIGASRARVVRGLLTESMLVALWGGALGIVATFVIRRWIESRIGADLTFFDFSIDPRVLAETAAITVASGLLVGIVPALYETRRLQANPLRTMATSDRVRQRWRHALVVLEIAVTVALLVETAALVDGYVRTRDANLGFPTRPLISMTVENPRGLALSALLDSVRAVPGVATAAASTAVPYAATGTTVHATADAGGTMPVAARQSGMTPTYFAALGVAMRAGRVWSDADASSRVAVINETLARRLFPSASAIGARIWIEGTPYDITGVVSDFSTNPMRAGMPEPKVFVPLTTRPTALTGVHLLVRASGDPAPLVRTLRRELQASSPAVTVSNAFTVDEILDAMGQEILIGTAPLFPLITIGLLLTTAGIYGVLAFAVARRSRELAIRLAIGASARDLVRLVSAHSARLVAIGCGLGIALTFALARLVRANGGAGSIFDPHAYVFATPLIVLGVVAIVATWVPSRRVLKIDPAAVLRDGC